MTDSKLKKALANLPVFGGDDLRFILTTALKPYDDWEAGEVAADALLDDIAKLALSGAVTEATKRICKAREYHVHCSEVGEGCEAEANNRVSCQEIARAALSEAGEDTGPENSREEMSPKTDGTLDCRTWTDATETMEALFNRHRKTFEKHPSWNSRFCAVLGDASYMRDSFEKDQGSDHVGGGEEGSTPSDQEPLGAAPTATNRAALPKPPYFKTRCEHCGWEGSSEECKEHPTGMGDADVSCPNCDKVFLCDEVGHKSAIHTGQKDAPDRPIEPPDDEAIEWQRSGAEAVGSKWAVFGQGLKIAREQRDLTLRDVEKQTGISIATLSRVENGHEPMADTYITLRDWIGLPKAGAEAVGVEEAWQRLDAYLTKMAHEETADLSCHIQEGGDSKSFDSPANDALVDAHIVKEAWQPSQARDGWREDVQSVRSCLQLALQVYDRPDLGAVKNKHINDALLFLDRLAPPAQEEER